MPAVAEVQFKATNSQTVVTAFNSIGTAATNAGAKVQQFTAAATTKVQQFTSSLNSIKSKGDPFSNLTTNLNGFNKSVDQSSQKATSFGQKLKGFGSQFGSSIATIGTLSGTILNLSRQYQDLSDSQIRVDRTQLKVSKTTEAVGVAQGKLNDLTAKGVTSGAEYEGAVLNVKQALEAQDLAQRNLVEAQEDHQRAQENFWISLVPTVTSAGASVISVLNDIGGTKGLGGLKTALGSLKTAFAGFTGLSGLATGISGIGTAAGGSVTGINGMTKGVGGLSLAMQGLARSSLPVAIALGGVALVAKAMALVVHEVIAVMKGDMLEAVKTMEKFSELAKTIGPLLGPAGGIGTTIFTTLGPKLKEFREELQKVPPAIKPIPTELQNMDNIAQGIDGTIDSLVGGVLGLVRSAESAPKPLNETGGAMTGVGTAATTAAPKVNTLTTSISGLTGKMREEFLKINKGAEFTGLTKMFAIDPKPISAGIDKLGQLSKAALGVGTSANAAALAKANLAKQSKILSTSAGEAARRQQQLSQALNQATQSLNKQYQAAQKVAHLNYGAPGKGPAGSHYTVFRNGKPIASGSGMAPPLVKPKQHGHQGTVHRPTLFIAGEGGRPEDVTVRPRGSAQRGGSSGGGGSTHITVSFEPQEFAQFIRYRINDNQGVVK